MRIHEPALPLDYWKHLPEVRDTLIRGGCMTIAEADAVLHGIIVGATWMQLPMLDVGADEMVKDILVVRQAGGFAAPPPFRRMG